MLFAADRTLPSSPLHAPPPLRRRYGSLLIPLPHSPNAAAALAFVILPPVIWAAQALAKSR